METVYRIFSIGNYSREDLCYELRNGLMQKIFFVLEILYPIHFFPYLIYWNFQISFVPGSKNLCIIYSHVCR